MLFGRSDARSETESETGHEARSDLPHLTPVAAC